jgi:hypothetical protein
MRKMMYKEVTKTTVKVAKMEIENGVPVAVSLPEVILLGNVQLERAQKIVSKQYTFPVVVVAVEAETVTYEMEVEEFIKVAKIKVDAETSAE